MIDANVMVAFSSGKVSEKVVKMLKYGGIYTSAVFKSFGELQKQIDFYNGGTIICGYKLSDSSIVQIIDDIPDNFNIILIGDKSQIEMCDDDRVFKLSVPLNKDELVCSVMMLINVDISTYFKPAAERSKDEKKIILKAKEILITCYGMTESQAYRYMQKKSMDTGVKMISIAKIILGKH